MKTALFAIAALLTSLVATRAQDIDWQSAKAEITADGVLTVEIVAKVTMAEGKGHISCVLQDANHAIGHSAEARENVEKGEKTVTLKRKITIPKDLEEVAIFTPVFMEGENKSTNVAMGRIDISWADPKKPTATVKSPKKKSPPKISL
jgi:hypothetical protein